MQLDQNPVFRKPITPWYDAGILCWTVVTGAVVIFAFAVQGVLVALRTPAFSPHLWFPLSLAGLNLFLAAKISLRMHRRKNNS